MHICLWASVCLYVHRLMWFCVIFSLCAGCVVSTDSVANPAEMPPCSLPSPALRHEPLFPHPIFHCPVNILILLLIRIYFALVLFRFLEETGTWCCPYVPVFLHTHNRRHFSILGSCPVPALPSRFPCGGEMVSGARQVSSQEADATPRCSHHLCPQFLPPVFYRLLAFSRQ